MPSSPRRSAPSSPGAATRSPTVAEGRWNGVAILSRAGLDDVAAAFADEPGFPDPEARALAATCGGLRVVVASTCPMGGRRTTRTTPTSSPGWRRSAALAATAARGTVVCGDFNVAPTDADVFDPTAFIGSTHVTPAEREALRALVATGLDDVVRRTLAVASRLHLLGLPRRHVPSGPRHADRPGAGERRRGGAGARSMDRSPGPQGHRAQRSRARHRRPGRGAGRRDRAGGAASFGAATASLTGTTIAAGSVRARSPIDGAGAARARSRSCAPGRSRRRACRSCACGTSAARPRCSRPPRAPGGCSPARAPDAGADPA